MTTPIESSQGNHLQAETVYSHPGATGPPDDTWWGRYSATLDGFTINSRTVLESDSRYIVDRGIFGGGAPLAPVWPQSRVRRGLVMGSVQSGKTASMLGVTALSLDRGVDIVVVLAGTRLSLWQQTLDRLQEQLDPGVDSAEKHRRRILLPRTPPTMAIPLATRYQLTPVRVERALRRGQPIIVVALKHAGHLQALRQSLAESVFPEISKLDRPVHMLVLDDEADDGSILDANVEASQDPIFGNLKQIPRAIVDLWLPPSQAVPKQLFATYVGYTATPQANFLQEEHNPLAPRDFLVTLRTPLDRGDLATRSSTYTEPEGINQYYTGGEAYYRRGRRAGLCVATTALPAEDLADSIRAFLVAGAIRLHRDSGRLGPTEAARTGFESADAVKAAVPRPHSMLVHPSALVDEHFTVAEDVLMWAGVASRSEARSRLGSGDSYLPGTLAAKLDVEEERWSSWLDRFRDSADQIHLEFNTLNPRQVPDWATIKGLLESEVIPGTRVSVVNSDPGADDRPEYSPTRNENGTWRAPRDMSTIFVSGNVMARGLTLEGLTTTLFLRSSENPLADTQMQMQRWFGYRGAHIELCRLFAPQDQIDFFNHYHDVDEALRNVIGDAMRDDSLVPSPVVLQGQGFLATGKIANLGNKPLHPGRKPFIPLINSGEGEDPNVPLVVDIFAKGLSADVTVGNRLRGRILTESLSLSQAADLLDRLSYDSYSPGSNNWQGELWSQVEARVNVIQPLQNGQHLYRPAEPSLGEAASRARKDCPYAIPAYLRLWKECLSRHVRGLFVTGERNQLWSMVPLAEKSYQQPRFWVGIRYGSGATAGGPLEALSFNIPVTQKRVVEGRIMTTWGANDPQASSTGYRGDEYFDYYHRGEDLPEAVAGEEPWRPAGSDGQILFYVNQLPDQAYPAIAVGVCVPTGGPDQFAAYVQPIHTAVA